MLSPGNSRMSSANKPMWKEPLARGPCGARPPYSDTSDIHPLGSSFQLSGGACCPSRTELRGEEKANRDTNGLDIPVTRSESKPIQILIATRNMLPSPRSCNSRAVARRLHHRSPVFICGCTDFPMATFSHSRIGTSHSKYTTSRFSNHDEAGCYGIVALLGRPARLEALAHGSKQRLRDASNPRNRIRGRQMSHHKLGEAR